MKPEEKPSCPLIGPVTLALLLSCLFFAPRLWVIASDAEGAPELVRGRSYLSQCEAPFRHDVEPAMRWRLLPPLVAHSLGLHGPAAFALPWLGIVCATIYVAGRLRTALPDRKFVFGGVLVWSTTAAVLAPAGFPGLNDAWVWLALFVVSFGRTSWGLPVAGLIGPWIDERMIIGYPLAWVVRCVDRQQPFSTGLVTNSLWLLPYTVTRLLAGKTSILDATSAEFLRASLSTNIRLVGLVPLAWFLSLRAAWIAVIFGAWSVSRFNLAVLATVFLATAIVTWLLASDLTRSAAIVSPLVLFGCITFARRYPAIAPRTILALGLMNLITPTAHIIYKSIIPANPLPLELYRLIRGIE